MLYWFFRCFVLSKNSFRKLRHNVHVRLFINGDCKKDAVRNLKSLEDLIWHENELIRLVNEFILQRRYMEAGFLCELFAMRGFSRLAFESFEARAREGLWEYLGWRSAFGKLHLHNAKKHQLGLHAADMVAKCRHSDLVQWCLEVNGANEDPQHHLALANSCDFKGGEQWLVHLNNYLIAQSLNTLRCQPVETDCFLGLAANFEQRPAQLLQSVSIDTLVTVCMTCYNAEKFVEVAVRSILYQTHRNLELLLINDRSTDGTLEILKRLALEDDRIVLVDNPVNLGTYASRNQAFQRARGEFFTVLDSDDFALPERLALQISHLKEYPQHIGVMTHWVRMQPNGSFHFRCGWGGVYQHPAVATLMVRTREVRETVGYWDCVRFSADSEYQHRLYKVWGRDKCPTLNLPTVIALYHENSLTNHPVTGISVSGVTGPSAARLAYRESWNYWHKKGERLYLPYPHGDRKFPAPPEMLV